MKSETKIIVAILLVGAIVVALGILSSTRNANLGGGLLSDTFTYKNITGANASSTFPVIVRGGAGTLGTITIGQPASTSAIRIYDGVATSSSDRTATSSGTLIMTISATSTAGAYGPMTLTPNVAVKKGILFDVPVGYGGSITVGSQ
jgi:hypothetical protein